ncbi:MAG: VanZ family protein [Deltaproteobacteria bacterium]|nr:VanZ family protein [Deltaproteobacteria bacterium]
MPRLLRKLLVFWIPIAVYIALIVSLSSMTRPPVLLSFPLSDKLLHFAEYAILAILIARALCSLDLLGCSVWKVGAATVAAALFIGGLDELYQSLVPHRCAEWLDLAADCLGAVAGVAIYFLVAGFAARRRVTAADG